MNQEQAPPMALLITRDGRRIDLDDLDERYVMEALDSSEKSDTVGHPFETLIDSLLMAKMHKRISKEKALECIEAFEADWRSLEININNIVKSYPDLIEKALAESKAVS